MDATSHYPTDYTSERVELHDGIGSRGNDEIKRLHEAGYRILEGINDATRARLAAAASQPHIREYCARDLDERFGSTEQTLEWLSGGRALLTLESEGVLIGYGWVGPKNTPEVKDLYDATMSIRLTEHGVGKGLATSFAIVLTEYALQQFGARGVWLEVWRSNERAIRMYERIGYVIVAVVSGVRDTQQDMRVFLAYTPSVEA